MPLLLYPELKFQMNKDEKSYQEFFKEEIYDGFVKFLLGKLGSAKVIALIGDEPVFTKKGVHVQLRRLFNEFLSNNKKIEKVYAANDGRCYLQRNIVNEPLLFPVNVNDDELMVKQGLRPSVFVPADFNFTRVGKHTKRTADPIKNQILKADWKEHKFGAPVKLVVHFKKSYATAIGKTTITYDVESKEEVADLLFDRFKDKVAFAQCQGHKFEFVKRRPHHDKDSKLRNQVQ